MPLLEVIPHAGTADDAAAMAVDMGYKQGKTGWYRCYSYCNSLNGNTCRGGDDWLHICFGNREPGHTDCDTHHLAIANRL